MKKRLLSILMAVFLAGACFVGCGSAKETESKETQIEKQEEKVISEETEDKEEPEITETASEGVTVKCDLENGSYQADFNTDSSMFHVNEMMDGKGTLTVKDGQMVIHITMPSKNIVNLFYGLAADAQKEEAEWIEPTEDEVTYDDGMTDTVYGFDIPVPALDEEFDVAILGKKGNWYDHKVSVSVSE